ncbi:alpha-ketoglutarate-dependent dioxygenase AlkB family protein [Pleomorphovibrio marinus]|uniref:alpha-ketoglutarate-dependent dioxygenase AlkB family protein n=1 Tax=Pleomorphovibrio marinus TaxID=2164132 RepID=UPI000E0BEC97|nr:alpha-ketoglutarate-dependent dioxygenase AlkB [Pleomorphovibrio marinus]
MHQNLLPKEGETYYYEGFFEPVESDTFFQKLKEEIDWKQEPIRIFGQWRMQPRLTALYGNPDVPYTYSRLEMKASPFTPTLELIRSRLSAFCDAEFTHVLLNLYRDGSDSMGWHRDNEASLGKFPVIASVSLGDTREFQLRHYRDKKQKIKVPLTHGSLLVMKGPTQTHWEHQIPKTAKEVGERINLTFRVIQA